jgi:Ran GTPase-activating protein (RanGAP) involved in mRNA processing and transport
LEELGQVNDDAPITNEELEALTVVLETNSSLKTLMLSATNSITTEGWVTFSAVLRNQNSKLEILVLYDSHMDDTVMNSFADALTINRNLQQLCVGNCDSVTVNGGYAALTRTLCNKSSILSTYHSNHTLNMLDGTSTFLPEELSSLLQINKYNNKNQAARLKIIMSHFSGNDIKMEPFAKMAVNVRPHAIEWMAKDMHLYRFLRAMPSLLDKVEDEGHLFI